MSDTELTTTLDLVRKAQRGDRDGLEALFERYYDRVLRVVRIRLGRGVRRDFDSGDIVGEAFLVAVRRFDDFEMRDEASFMSWMRAIIERKIMDAVGWQKAASRTRDREVLFDHSSHNDGNAALNDATQALEASEDTLVVDECLSSLPTRYRDTILLREYEGHRWSRIAELLKCSSADAARMLHKTALVELGKAIRRRRRGMGGPD